MNHGPPRRDGAAKIPQREIEELLARTPLGALVGRRVKLERSGRNHIGCCPFHEERTPSFHVYPDHYHCFGCGEHGNAITFVMKSEGVSFPNAVALLKSDAGINEKAPLAAAQSQPVKSARRRDDRPLAFWLWQESLPPTGTLAEKYLWFRGAAVPRRSCLRFHPACPRGATEKLPAMIAPMTTPCANEFCGIHRTFLRADGMGKIEHGTQKMMLGNAGVVRLTPDDEITIGLGICEGIETGLAVLQRAGWGAIWATCGAGGIRTFPVLPGIECLSIFPDRDDKGAGAAAAEACAERWSMAGREVQIIWPPDRTDWNDCLARLAA